MPKTMPPRYKSKTWKNETSLRVNVNEQLKKLQKPKKNNRKLRNDVIEVKGMNQDMKEAVDAALEAFYTGEHDDVKARLEQIQMDLGYQKTHIQMINTRLWQKADQAIEDFV